MFRFAFLLALLLSSPTLQISPGSSDAQATSRAERSEIALAREPYAALSADQIAAVDWALRRFEQVGLLLPDMSIEFDPSKRECGSAEGRYRYDGEAHRVTVCTRAGASFRADLERRRTLLHEFAHAWDATNLDDAERARIARHLGVHTWNDPDDRWEDRGAERFAEVFVFGLLDQPLRQLKAWAGCKTMVTVFRATTGRPPLGPGAPVCP